MSSRQDATKPPPARPPFSSAHTTTSSDRPIMTPMIAGRRILYRRVSGAHRGQSAAAVLAVASGTISVASEVADPSAEVPNDATESRVDDSSRPLRTACSCPVDDRASRQPAPNAKGPLVARADRQRRLVCRVPCSSDPYGRGRTPGRADGTDAVLDVTRSTQSRRVRRARCDAASLRRASRQRPDARTTGGPRECSGRARWACQWA